MDAQKLHALLLSHFPNASLMVRGEAGKFEVHISSAHFSGKNTIERHRAVYAAVNEYIRSGVVHALTIKTHTPEENPPVQKTII